MSTNKDQYDMSEEDDNTRLVFSQGPYPLRHNRIFQCLVLVVALLAVLCVVLIILLSIKKSDSSTQENKPLKIVGDEQTTSPTTSPPRTPTTKQRPTPNAETTNATKGKENNSSTVFKCFNENIYCGYWTLIGECQKNPKYMLDKCCLWCSHLEDIKGQNCTNNHKNCVVWTNRGECWKNPAYMLDNCCRSCNDKGHSPAILKKETGEQ